MSMGMRTLWISIRALNYTSEAFTQIINHTGKLKASEDELAKTNLNLIRGGMMFAAMGGTFISAMLGIISSTGQGSAFMARFNIQMQAATRQLGTALLQVLAPALTFFANIITTLSRNPALMTIVSYLMVFGTAALIAAGAGMILTGAIGMMMGFGPVAAILNLISLAAIKMGISFNMALASLGILVAAFTAFMVVKEYIGPVATAIVAAIISIVTAIIALKAVASFGTTLGPDIAAIAGAVAVGSGAAAGVIGVGAATGAYDSGTRFSSSDNQIAMLSAGEKVINPRRGLPTSEMNSGNVQPKITNNYVNMPVQNLHTQAKFSDVNEQINKGLRDVAISVR